MASIAQRNFAAGELSPSLYARADQTKYQSGLRRCENFIVRKSGGVSNRAGLRWLYEVEGAVRLVPFQFSDDQTYCLVFFDGRFRILKQGAWVRIDVDSPVLYEWTSMMAFSRSEFTVHEDVYYVCIQSNSNKQPDLFPDYWLALEGDIFEYPTPYNAQQTREFNYQQSGDVIIIVHNEVQPSRLVRLDEGRWDITAFTLGPNVDPPASVSVTPGAAGAIAYDYVVTSVNAGTYEESAASTSATGTSAEPTDAVPNVITWTADPYAIEYNIYKKLNGVYRYLGTASATTYNDVGVKPSSTDGPPVEISMFATAGDYPAVVAFVQQRLVFASTTNEPEKVWFSRIGAFNNFTYSTPLQDDDAISFTLAGRKVARVRSIIEVGGVPVMFTQSGEWLLEGDADGVITPTAINAKQIAYNGCASVEPVVIDDTVVYVQARGSVVRDLRYQVQSEGYSGKDLTVYSDHLFRNKTALHATFQQNPYSVMWVVMSDGRLLGLSYLREHEIWGWHPHSTDGEFIDAVAIPEGVNDSLYVLVDREIEGVTHRYVELMVDREEEVIEDCFYVDSGLSYDGINTDPEITMRIDGGPYVMPTWVPVQCSAEYFTEADVGNAIVFYQYDDDGNLTDSLTVTIKEFVDASNVNGEPSKDTPEWVLDADISTWAKAVDEFAGLDHLEGKLVSILADGTVVSNGVDLPNYVVEDGAVTIPRPAVKAHIGLPYVSVMETLEIENPQGQSIRSKPKLISHVSLLVEKTNGLRSGVKDPALREYKIRETEPMGAPTNLKTGHIDVSVPSTWDEDVRVITKQLEPLPASINAVIPLLAGVGET